MQIEWVCWFYETPSLLCFIPFKKRYNTCFGCVMMTDLHNVEIYKEQASVYCT
jgi:hypothetical protein